MDPEKIDSILCARKISRTITMLDSHHRRTLSVLDLSATSPALQLFRAFLVRKFVICCGDRSPQRSLSTPRVLESVQATSGIPSFVLAINPNNTESKGFLGESLLAEVWSSGGVYVYKAAAWQE